MSWFKRRDSKSAGDKDGGQEDAGQQVQEFLDPYHHRASIVEDGRVMFDGGQILENIALAIERLDNDIQTPISIEEDVSSLTELSNMTKLGMGSALMAQVVNTGMRVMLARYPEDLVRVPVPADYDLRTMFPLNIADAEHDLAARILSRRLPMTEDLDSDDLFDDLEPVSWQDQLNVFVALFYMVGNRIGAIKYTTGID